jgi:WD40 repeat protein
MVDGSCAVVVGCRDGTLWLCDVISPRADADTASGSNDLMNKRSVRLDMHAGPVSDPVTHMALAGPEQQVVLVVDVHGRGSALDLMTGKPRYQQVDTGVVSLTELRRHDLAGQAAALLVDDRGAHVWDLTSASVVPAGAWPRRQQDQTVPATALLLNGTYVTVTGDIDGALRLHQTVTNTPVGEPLPAHRGPVTALTSVEIAGHLWVVSGGGDGTVRVWDPATRLQQDVIEMLGEVTALAATVDGYLMVAAAGEVIAFRHADMIRSEEMR